MQNELDIGQIIEDNSDYLLAFALTKISDVELAKDLVQDTFVSAMTKIETFEHRSKVRTWLTSILNRKIIDFWRKAETRYTDNISSFFDGKKHWIEDSERHAEMDTIEDQIIQEERIDDLYDCISGLPSKWKAIIASKYLDEKSTEEICKEYDITSSNLWVIIHRSKLNLRKCLQNKFK